jgi:outer membrane protein
MRRAEANVRLARSVLLPKLDLNGASTWYGDDATLDLAPGESFVIRPSNDWSWSADLNQTLFYGLRDWRAKDVARLRLDIARLERLTAANDLTLQVAAAYLTARSDLERVDVARTTLEQIEAQLKVAERRHEVGETAFADVARWRSEKAAAVQAMVVAEGNSELALRRLARVAGVDELGPLERLRRIPAPHGTDGELVAQGWEQRLEMITLKHQLEASGLYVKIEKGAWLPEVEAHAQYFRQKAEFPSSDWTSVALTARVPIYDGGLTAARVAEAREDLRLVELLEREVRKAIADQVESAAIGFRAATATYDAARERLTAAREANRQVERAYRVGEASATDLLATTAELTDAETTSIIAHAQREYQAIALRHAVGLTPLPDLDPMPILDPPKQDPEE